MPIVQDYPRPWQVVDPPSGWYRTRTGLWTNCGGELYTPVRPTRVRLLRGDRRARAIIVRRNGRKHEAQSYEATVVRAVLWPRLFGWAPYDAVVRAVAPWEMDAPEAFVYRAVTDPAALVSVLVRVEEP